MASDDKIFDLGTTIVTAPRLPVSYVGDGDLTPNPPVNIVLGFNSVMTDTPEYKEELGDFYPFNFTGPSNVGFGALAAFSPSTDYFVWF